LETRTVTAPAWDDVLRWRRDQLVAAGFEPPVALTLAQDSRYDLHALIELAERDCPPRLAIRILAPLEGPNA
jgi:hypothetical protein